MNLFSRYRGLWTSALLLLGLGLFSYHVRELLFCWLYFGFVFGFLVLLIVCGVLAYHAGTRAMDWVNMTMHATPAVNTNSEAEASSSIVALITLPTETPLLTFGGSDLARRAAAVPALRSEDC